jgi:enamine deaminase RidA (YjgF/YER057c/UK114 family)
MQRHCSAPYPARSTVGVASLPRGALFEAEAVLVLG